MSKLVYIAAGHGGPKDPGAVSDGMVEKNINLKVALFLRDYLKDYDCDIKMSRVADTPAPTIAERCAEAAKLKADCFLDIHHNGGGGVGGEAFFWHSDKKAQALAALVAQEFKAIGQRLRSVRGYPEGTKPSGKDGTRIFGVCRINAGKGVPAILGEFAFLDSAADRVKIDTDDKLRKQAQAYCNAVVAFLSLKKKAPVVPTQPVTSAQPDVYVVKPGDTLSRIASAHKVTLTALLAANPQIKQPNRIYVGQQIKIPKKAATPVEKPSKLLAGAQLSLNKTPLYVSATAKLRSRTLTGTYYMWDSKVVNGRRRITNSAGRVGKFLQVTGWIDEPES